MIVFERSYNLVAFAVGHAQFHSLRPEEQQVPIRLLGENILGELRKVVIDVCYFDLAVRSYIFRRIWVVRRHTLREVALEPYPLGNNSNGPGLVYIADDGR